MLRFIKGFLHKRVHGSESQIRRNNTGRSCHGLHGSSPALSAKDIKNHSFNSECDFLGLGASSAEIPQFEEVKDWQFISKLGEGNFSIVYLARNVKTMQESAVKVISCKELNAKQRQAVFKEVSILRRAQHSKIIKLLGFEKTEKYYFIFLELMSGGELFHRIVDLRYFSEPLARHVILQVASAIRYLHQQCGVAHRDIKTENILVQSIPIIPSPDIMFNAETESGKRDEGVFVPNKGGGGIGEVKLADFGLSKVIWNDHTGTPCGTVGYTAPEVIKAQKYTKAVDLWGLGCVLYTMLCGFPPFYDEDTKKLSYKVAKGEWKFLSPWWDEISDEVKDLISNLLTVDPSQRYTIEEFFQHPWCRLEVPKSSGSRVDRKFSFYEEKEDNTGGSSDSSTISPRTRSHSLRTPLSGDTHNVAMKAALHMSYAVHLQKEKEALKQIGLKYIYNKESFGAEDGSATSVEHKLDVILDSNTDESQGFQLNLGNSTLLEKRRAATNC